MLPSYGNVMINGQAFVNLVAPTLPAGYFFRVDRVEDDYYNDMRTRVAIRQKCRFFGSSPVMSDNLKGYESTPERVHEVMIKQVEKLEDRRRDEERDVQLNRQINKLLGDFPPRTTI